MDNIVEKARKFAEDAHRDQKYGDAPYTHHLEMVVKLAEFFIMPPEMIRAACWLHDVLEDTDVTREELATEFGKEIADIVWAVTNEPGKNRAARVAATYPKIAASSDATLVKLFDRMANTYASRFNNKGLFAMYKKEYPAFKKALYKSEHEKFWEQLESLMAEDASLHVHDLRESQLDPLSNS